MVEAAMEEAEAGSLVQSPWQGREKKEELDDWKGEDRSL